MAACVLLWGTTAGAGSMSEETRCTIVKLKASVKELKDKAHCYERSLKAGVPVAGACLARAEDKRERLFRHAEERGGCKTTKDGASLGTRADSYLLDLTRALEGATTSAATPAPTVGKKPEGSSEAAEATKGTPAKAAEPTEEKPKEEKPEGKD